MPHQRGPRRALSRFWKLLLVTAVLYVGVGLPLPAPARAAGPPTTTFTLRFDHTAPPHLHSGDVISVQGNTAGEEFVLAADATGRTSLTRLAPAAPTTVVAGEHKTLVTEPLTPGRRTPQGAEGLAPAHADGHPNGSAGLTYSYYVVAYDAAGNVSAASNTVSVTIPKSKR